MSGSPEILRKHFGSVNLFRPWAVAVGRPPFPFSQRTVKLRWDSSKDTSEPKRFALEDVPDAPKNCVTDSDGNGSVDFEDLLTLLSAYGNC